MPGSRDIRQLGTQCENELIASPTCRWKKRGWVTRQAVAQLSNREPDRTVASSDASARGSLSTTLRLLLSSLLCGRSGSFAAHTGGAFRHASRLGGSRRRWGDWERLHRTSKSHGILLVAASNDHSPGHEVAREGWARTGQIPAGVE